MRKKPAARAFTASKGSNVLRSAAPEGVASATKFARHKLGDDDARGANVITPSSLRARGNRLVWRVGSSRFGWGREAFIAGLRVERDSEETSQVNVVLPPDVVNGMRIFAAKLEFRL